jgi:hypothetical protein
VPARCAFPPPRRTIERARCAGTGAAAGCRATAPAAPAASSAGLFLARAAFHEFVEAASLSAFRPILAQKCQLGAVEFLEKFIPRDRLQRTLTAESGKVDAQDSRFGASAASAARPCGGGGLSAALLDPSANFLVIGHYIGFCRHNLSSLLNRVGASAAMKSELL